VKVTPELLIEGENRIFAIGDMAAFKNPKNQQALPGLAPVAIQQGRWVAKNILKLRDQKPLEPFKYLDKGQMATIGRRRAVLQFGDLRTAGFFAWLVWLIIHIYYLIGFKNRLFVFFQWAWSYLTFSRGARLIVEKDWKQN
jgi:NADH dehydrogenase